MTPMQGAPPQSMQPPQQGAPAPADMPITIDAVMALLRDGALRRFRIDIEADSTIASDDMQEKSDRAQLIESITKLVVAWGPIVGEQPLMAPLAAELMMFGVRAFRVGRTLEQTIEETAEKFIAQSGQPKPPPQPSPDEMVKLQGTQAKVQAEIQKAQIGVQQAQVEAQAKIAQHQSDMQARAQEQAAKQQQAAQDQYAAQQQAHTDAGQASLEAGHAQQAALMDHHAKQTQHANQLELMQAKQEAAMQAAQQQWQGE